MDCTGTSHGAKGSTEGPRGWQADLLAKPFGPVFHVDRDVYAGAIIGVALPLASAVAHSVNPVDMIIWGVFALAVQVLVYFLVRKLLPHLNEQIPHDRCAPAVLVAAMSVAAGIVNAACLTY